jgi:hypothetical protein
MLIALKFLVGYSFFVYIGIAYFSNQFLMLPYALIPFLLIFSKSKHKKSIENNFILFSMFFLYSASILINLVTGSLGEAGIILSINFLIFILVFLAFSSTIYSKEKLLSFLNIYLYGLTCALAYGVFQIIFGYRDFELKSIERMGSLLIEFEKMGRFRVTSTFVDPLLSSFTFCIGFFICWLKIAIINIEKNERNNIFALKILACASLALMASTLTRAPMLGFVVGVIGSLLTYYSRNFNSLIKIICISLVTLPIANFLVESAVESGLINNPDILKTVLSIKSIFRVVDPSDESYFLIGQSRDHRMNAIGVAFEYMIENFGNYGDSVINPSLLNISFVDIGLLKIGVISGLITYILLEIIYFYLLWKIYLISIQEDDSRYRLIASITFGLWLSIIVAINISDISLGIMPSVFIWMIGAIIYNFKIIFKKYNENI